VRFVVLHDPGRYPLAAGAELPLREVFYGLQLRGFYPGTRLLDRIDRTTHTVVRQGRRLVLLPPSPAVERWNRRREARRMKKAKESETEK